MYQEHLKDVSNTFDNQVFHFFQIFIKMYPEYLKNVFIKLSNVLEIQKTAV